jgi:hypothetical protein
MYDFASESRQRGCTASYLCWGDNDIRVQQGRFASECVDLRPRARMAEYAMPWRGGYHKSDSPFPE